MWLVIWHKIKTELTIWHVGIFPAITEVWLGNLKWIIFDKIFLWQNQKSGDTRIILVDTNNEDDNCNWQSNYIETRISNRNLATLFGKLQIYKPKIVGLSIASLLIISYLLLIWSWWLPVIPASLILTINCLEIIALYQYDQALRLGMKTRQAVIESTFETIHNGPLQSLAKIMKLVRCQDINTQDLLPKIEKELEKLNYELRGIYEFLQQEYPSQDMKLYLGNNLALSLQDPLHEVLYQVYSYTLERDFPCFKTIKVAIRTFDPINEQSLSMEQKRGICRFLEEALCNVGKHATGVTRLQVTCSLLNGWYNLIIIDNGLGANSYKQGRGTQQFINLARQLQGKFRRSPLLPQGTICELSWPATKF